MDSSQPRFVCTLAIPYCIAKHNGVAIGHKVYSSGFYTSLFIENIIKLYEESGKINYRTNDFFRKIFRTRFVSPCKNYSPEQKINHKNKSRTECTALQRVLFGRFHVSITT